MYEFKVSLRWIESENEAWVCRDGVPLLAYASVTDCVLVVREVLAAIDQIEDRRERYKVLNTRVSKKGLVELGILGHMTPLMSAMITSKHCPVS